VFKKQIEGLSLAHKKIKIDEKNIDDIVFYVNV